MADRFLKHKVTGQVFVYQAVFAQRGDFEECADAQGTPMNVFEGEFRVVVDDEAPAKPAKRNKRSREDEAALQADASRGQ